ncbi:MAG: AAA family ATPase, partial [Deltaproteobacteria bacterium]|nr:AAA family ATPase [Deltaproteobacteria bacterium]
MPPEELPKLPIGWQGFEDLRLGKAVYVDKTGYLPMVRKAGRFVFCARPRRFGKSLTVTALDAFYSGRIDLFRGLAAEKVMDTGDFVARPVIRLDMLSVAGSGNMDILERNFIDC